MFKKIYIILTVSPANEHLALSVNTRNLFVASDLDIKLCVDNSSYISKHRC